MCGSILPKAETKGVSFRRRHNKIGTSFCDIFDNFMLNFIVTFLVEGTNFKLMTAFSVRG